MQPNCVRGAERVSAVEVTADTAGDARPSPDEPVVAQLGPGTRAHWLETSDERTRIELEMGGGCGAEQVGSTGRRP